MNISMHSKIYKELQMLHLSELLQQLWTQYNKVDETNIMTNLRQTCDRLHVSYIFPFFRWVDDTCVKYSQPVYTWYVQLYNTWFIYI